MMKHIPFLSILLLVICSCRLPDRPDAQRETAAQEQVADTAGLPFTGIRGFVTRPAVEGTGTPHRFIEIKTNGDVYFSFEQVNQADGTLTRESYYAGKYKLYMKCVFQKLDNETTWYEIGADKIFETDAKHKRISAEDCCSGDLYAEGQQCPCESGYDPVPR